MKRDAATERQVQAADPGNSTWLSANAGSGKTRVLTDRVARLLLDHVQPQHILCLTYTKAAASEMQNRLFKRLGEWAMLDAETLTGKLRELGLEGEIRDETLREARRLFARAIETPGGLKIQTIHSFCASLLRRFPLEAGVSPQFVEMDDRAARRLREDILEDLADGPAPDLFDGIAAWFTGDDLDRLMGDIAKHRDAFPSEPDAAAIWDMLDLLAGYDEDALKSEVFLGGEAELLSDLRAALAAGTSTDMKAADKLKSVDTVTPVKADYEALEGIFLTGAKAKEPFSAKIGSFPTKKTREAHPGLMPALEALMLRVEAARPRRLSLIAARKTLTLHRFAAAFLPEYEARKLRHGWLDFDDLILKARDLLTDRSVAEWVLYRLDGGIDHILVDEAQDTSPLQWEVIDLLAQEFTSGQGARDVPRTIFVVGDQKQSIYSFQGADPDGFDRMRRHFAGRLENVSVSLENLLLEYSFRSSPAILRVVDAAVSPWGVKITRIEIKDIDPPSDLVDSMGRQMKAEREKRATILEAEGRRQAAILKAEGEKQAQVLEAEGRREAAFRDAEARERAAEAEAKATQLVSEAIAAGNVQAINYFVANNYIKALEKVATSPNQKLLMLPVEASSVIGAIGGIAEIARETFGAEKPVQPRPASRPPASPPPSATSPAQD